MDVLLKSLTYAAGAASLAIVLTLTVVRTARADTETEEYCKLCACSFGNVACPTAGCRDKCKCVKGDDSKYKCIPSS